MKIFLGDFTKSRTHLTKINTIWGLFIKTNTILRLPYKSNAFRSPQTKAIFGGGPLTQTIILRGVYGVILRTVRNSDKGDDLRETHRRRNNPALGIWKPGRSMGGTRGRVTSKEGSDGRSGVWMESTLREE